MSDKINLMIVLNGCVIGVGVSDVFLGRNLSVMIKSYILVVRVNMDQKMENPISLIGFGDERKWTIRELPMRKK